MATAATWVAHGLNAPGGERRAIVFNLFGMLDLIVAAGLGITTNLGPAHLFHTVPTSEVLTRFPMALVTAFLVPLAFTLHVVSLWQLVGGSWAGPSSPQVRGYVVPARYCASRSRVWVPPWSTPYNSTAVFIAAASRKVM